MHTRGVITRRSDGSPVPRVRPTDTPCGECPKIPLGVPKLRRHAIEPTERTRRCLTYLLECQAVRRWPDDALVAQNARIVAQVQAAVRENRERRTQDLLELVLMKMGAGNG